MPTETHHTLDNTTGNEITIQLVREEVPVQVMDFKKPFDLAIGFAEDGYGDGETPREMLNGCNPDGEIAFFPPQAQPLLAELLTYWENWILNRTAANQPAHPTPEARWISGQGGVLAIKSTAQGHWVVFLDGECGSTPLQAFLTSRGIEPTRGERWDPKQFWRWEACHMGEHIESEQDDPLWLAIRRGLETDGLL